MHCSAASVQEGPEQVGEQERRLPPYLHVRNIIILLECTTHSFDPI